MARPHRSADSLPPRGGRALQVPDDAAWELRSGFDSWVNAHSALVIMEGELLELAIKVGEGRCELTELDTLSLEVEERRQLCQKLLSEAMGSRAKARAPA